MAAKTRAERRKILEDKLRKIPDFNAAIVAADAGAFGDCSASMCSDMTSDFHTDADERSREGKATALTLWTIAYFFALRHDDVMKEHGEVDDPDARKACLDIDDMRVELVNKMWAFHEMIVKRLFSGNSAEDAHGRKSAGNNVNLILKDFLHTRRACLSQEAYEDPDYAPTPPTKTDFVSSTTHGKTSEEVLTPAEKLDGEGDLISTTETNAIAIEEQNEQLLEILRKEKEESARLKEELKNLEATHEMQKQKRREKRRKEQEDVNKIRMENQEIIDKMEKIRREISKETEESADGDDAAEGHASPVVAAPQQVLNPTPAVSQIQPDFSKLIHTLELDAVRRNVIGVRPQQPFEKYNADRKGEYNILMNTFDSAFGKIQGITGNEKVTELSGHWFAGAAKRAINAAKPTANDPNGDAAFKEVRRHLDSIYAQDADSAADALERLKEGGAIARDSLVAHQDFYMNMLEARNSAMTTSSAELFDRRSSLLEIISARMPFQCEKFFENYEQGNGFQKLLDFVLKRINLLKIIQTSSKPERSETETTRTNHQHHLLATNHQTQHQFEQNESCMYCKNHHHTSMCDKLFYLSVRDRVTAISKLHLCYHCLLPGHTASSCPEKTKVTCNICARKGHITLFHGRHLLHSHNGSPDQRRRDGANDNDEAESVLKVLDSVETEEENELLL